MSAPDRTKAPAAAPLPEVRVPEARETELAGGGRLTAVPGGEQPVARLVLMWEGGTFDSAVPAAATVLADVLPEGTRTLSAEAIADSVDFGGARLSTRAADHFTGMSLLGLSDRLADMLPLLRSIAAEPLLSADAVEMIARRQATAAAIRQAKVSVRSAQAVRALVAGAGHPASRPDTAEGYLAVTAEDVADVYRRTIGRGRRGVHAFLGGRFDDSLPGRIAAMLESLGDGDGTPSPVSIVPFSPETPRRVDIEAPDAVQSAVSMAIPAIGREHPDYIPLRLAVTALGGYFGSRLMTDIREERGLTYGISAHLLGSPEGAMVQIDAQCAAANVDEVIDCALREVRGLWERPLEAEELHRLRLSAWSALAAQADSPLSVLDYYVTRTLVRMPRDYFSRHMETIRNLTAETVADTARRYLGDREWAVATCGPRPAR